MSAPMSLSAYSLSKTSRGLLARGGFTTKQAIVQLRPTQLAHELGITPQAALALLQELHASPLILKAETAVVSEAHAATQAASGSNASGSSAGGVDASGDVQMATGEEQRAIDIKSPFASNASHTSTSNTIQHAGLVVKSEQQFGENALDLMRRRAGLKPIKSHCDELDQLMGGGVPVGQLTEFCGVPGAGKTQLCLQLAFNVQIPKRLGGAWEGEAIYIDTEGSFMAQRAEQLAHTTLAHMSRVAQAAQQKALASGKPSPAPIALPTVEQLMRGVHVFRVFDHVEQLALLRHLSSFLRAHPAVHLLVIDSVAFHFRRGFVDMGLRSRLLTGMAQELLDLGNRHQMAVVVTNQVSTRFESSLQSALTPALGESWAHSCTNRIMLDHEADGRVARLIKSPTMRAAQVPYVIGEKGIASVTQHQQQPTHPPTQSPPPHPSTHQPTQPARAPPPNGGPSSGDKRRLDQ